MTNQNNQNKILYLVHFGCLLIIGISLPVVVAAQFDLPTNQLPNLNMAPTLSLSIDPVTPLPNSAFTVTANLSGITNVNNSNYSWFLNGTRQTAASGTNKNALTVRTGAIGTVYNVGVTISTPAGDNLSDSISTTASDVDLTWNSNNEAPAGYRGKLLPTRNSLITVSALPFIYNPGTKNLIGSGNLIYNWNLDDKFNANESGVNKPIYSFRAYNFAGGSHAVRLEIKSSDGKISLNKGVSVPIAAPQTLVYFADSKTNLPFGMALKNLTTISLSFNFIAQNYFFNKSSDQLRWQWLVDNKEISGSGGEEPWLATLNIPDSVGLPFFTQIQVIAKNPNNELEAAESTINLEIR
jgi:hypothetical protein